MPLEQADHLLTFCVGTGRKQGIEWSGPGWRALIESCLFVQSRADTAEQTSTCSSVVRRLLIPMLHSAIKAVQKAPTNSIADAINDGSGVVKVPVFGKLIAVASLKASGNDLLLCLREVLSNGEDRAAAVATLVLLQAPASPVGLQFCVDLMASKCSAGATAGPNWRVLRALIRHFSHCAKMEDSLCTLAENACCIDPKFESMESVEVLEWADCVFLLLQKLHTSSHSISQHMHVQFATSISFS